MGREPSFHEERKRDSVSGEGVFVIQVGSFR